MIARSGAHERQEQAKSFKPKAVDLLANKLKRYAHGVLVGMFGACTNKTNTKLDADKRSCKPKVTVRRSAIVRIATFARAWRHDARHLCGAEGGNPVPPLFHWNYGGKVW